MWGGPQRPVGIRRGVCTVPSDWRCPQWPRGKGAVERGILGAQMAMLTLADLHDAHDDDEGEGQQLAGGEYVLHPGGPPDAGAVHPCQQH